MLHVLTLLVSGLVVAAPPVMDEDTTVLLMVADGLRPDYVTPDLMPNLCREAEGGVLCTAHHAAIPTLTRVNSATLSTGCYPAHHGIVDNTLYFKEIEPAKGLTTGKRDVLLRIEKATGKGLLDVPSLAEVAARHDQNVLVCSVGSSGAATLLNPGGFGAGTINREYVLPEERTAHVLETVGPWPPDVLPGYPRTKWVMDAYLRIGIAELHPRATIMWISDPDHTAHKDGVGGPKTNAGIRFIDEQLGRIIDEHRKRGMKVNVFVAADHGFSTHTGGLNVRDELVAAGLKESADSTDVVVIGGNVYVNEGGEERVAEIVRLLQANPNVGALFTRSRYPQSKEGAVPGTLSFAMMQWDHPRAADVWVDNLWTNARNAFGYPGTTNKGGTAGHGSTSPWDIHATLIAFGPDIKGGVTNPAPTHAVDVTTTIAYLLGLPENTAMDGRVLKELLRDEPAPEHLNVEEEDYTVTSEDGTYRLTLNTSICNGHRYVNFTRVERGT